MNKYFIVFKMSVSRVFAYRLNFLFGRLRNIVVLLLLYSLWSTLLSDRGSFAMYSEAQLLTYLFLAMIVRSAVFGAQSRDIAEEINSGIFSKYLAMPVSYFWFNLWRELAQRVIVTAATLIEAAVFIAIVRPPLVWPDMSTSAWFAVSVLGAYALFTALSYLVSLIAFWSREAMGPRFLFDWTVEFMSGAFFPLAIFSAAAVAVFIRLPFFYLVFFPVSVWLGHFQGSQAAIGVLWQALWTISVGAIAAIVWQKGLRRFTGEGL